MMKRFLLVSAMAALVVVGACRRASAQSVTIDMVTVAAPFVGGGAARAQSITIDMVTVGNPRNAADFSSHPYGAVPYEYRIGTYEVTNAQYCAFLNAVAKTDPYGLYNPYMGSNVRAGIARRGDSGSYSYSTKTFMADKPVNFVSWYDALRFSNWLHNGQGSGDTETGAYTMAGIDGTSTAKPRNADAKYWLPSENEWYKGAYYGAHGPNRRYWLYATQSDTPPKPAHCNANGVGDGYWTPPVRITSAWTPWPSPCPTPEQPPADRRGVRMPEPTPENANNAANYGSRAHWPSAGGDMVPGAATSVGTNGGPSAYGAFDMAGNVAEWTETLIAPQRGIRGGSWGSGEEQLRSDRGRYNVPPTTEDYGVGFRVAGAIPASPETPAAPEKKDAAVRQWGTEVEGQALSIAVEKAAYAAEEPIVLDVVYKNVGQLQRHAIEGLPLDALVYRLIVSLPGGKEAAPLTLYGKRAHENWADWTQNAEHNLQLKPGEERPIQFALSRLFDFSLPGTYTVTVERKVVLVRLPSSSTSRVASNTLEITVDESLACPPFKDGVAQPEKAPDPFSRQYPVGGRYEVRRAELELLDKLSHHSEWWAPLYVAEIMGRHEAFRQPEIVERLRHSWHPLVRQAIAALPKPQPAAAPKPPPGAVTPSPRHPVTPSPKGSNDEGRMTKEPPRTNDEDPKSLNP